jgi:hypothetical protein
MTPKALATIPTAFLVGICGPLGYRAFEQWAQARAIALTRSTELIAYAVIILAPFLVFVIGVDPKRWDENHRFSQEGKMDQRQTWMRWAAYFVGAIVGYAL